MVRLFEFFARHLKRDPRSGKFALIVRDYVHRRTSDVARIKVDARGPHLRQTLGMQAFHSISLPATIKSGLPSRPDHNDTAA